MADKLLLKTTDVISLVQTMSNYLNRNVNFTSPNKEHVCDVYDVETGDIYPDVYVLKTPNDLRFFKRNQLSLFNR